MRLVCEVEERHQVIRKTEAEKEVLKRRITDLEDQIRTLSEQINKYNQVIQQACGTFESPSPSKVKVSKMTPSSPRTTQLSSRFNDSNLNTPQKFDF